MSRQLRKRSESITVTGQQLTTTILDYGKRTEPLVLQLKEPLGMIERLRNLPERHWDEGEHVSV